MRFSFFIAAVLFCATGASNDIVTCCAHTPCLLHLEVGLGANVSWINSDTGQAPLCLSNGMCNATQQGLQFSANFSEDGLYIALIKESNYEGAEHYYLVYIYGDCYQTANESAHGPISRPLNEMPLPSVTINASLFYPAFLELPPQYSNDLSNVRWYKVDPSGFQAQKISKVRSGGRKENLHPNWALVTYTGDLLVLHVSPNTLGLWLAAVQHRGGRTNFITFNITVPNWQQNLVTIFNQHEPPKMGNNYKDSFMEWTLFKKLKKGLFRVTCRAKSIFPECTLNITRNGTFLLTGESKKTPYVILLPFFANPKEDTPILMALSHSVPVAIPNTAMPVYISIMFFIVAMLATLSLLMGLNNKIRPM
ncbi:E3 ORFA [Canine mastadenovirus A]|nr:E3 ORFA [Canine mastadenovirus A]